MDLNRRSSQPGRADVMNDPAYATNRGGTEKGRSKSSEEQDTCRICRGEGSREEPLFYPCKCSGSIKFVHQVCLMEWLSHSQKKHCELCKTSFRFTKLYDPQMPSTVPLGVFIRQAAIDILKSLLTWVRWNLVIFVWLGWVPWCMRTVWRGLFWVGDGGWITRQDIERHTAYMEKLAAEGSSPMNSTLPFQAEVTTSALFAKVSSMVGLVPNFGEPTVLWLGKRLLRSLLPSMTVTFTNSTTNVTSLAKTAERSPSLLSDFAILRRLTRWDRVNNIIIDVLEGQLITLFVVVAFILIFLIREWVVQQQPAINIGAAINVEAAVADGRNNIEDQQRNNAVQPEHQGNDAVDRVADEQAQNPEEEQAQNPEEEQGLDPPPEAERRLQPRAVLRPVGPQRRLFPTTRREDLAQGHLPDDVANPNPNESRFQIPRRVSQIPNSPEGSPSFAPDPTAGPSRWPPGTQRPSIPARDVSPRASSIQRILQERSTADGPNTDVFMHLWNRAAGDPAEVIRMIEENGKTRELGWIVASMERRIQDAQSSLKEDSTDTSGTDLQKDEATQEQASEGSNGSWQVIEEASLRPESPTVPRTEVPGPAVAYVDSGESNSRLPADSDMDHGPEAPTDVAASEGSPHSVSDLLTQDHHDDHTSDQVGDNDISQSSTTEAPGGTTTHHIAAPAPSELEADIAAPIVENNPTQQNLARDMPPERVRPQNLAEAVGDWLWGEVPEVDAAQEEPEEDDDEHVVQDVANEEPFVPRAQGQLVLRAENAPEDRAPVQADPEVLRAAAEAGIDPGDAEAVEDGEDLEGVMDLIGMQGPLAGLVQNGMFSAVLISLSVFFGIWIPYIAGKLVLVFLANPVSLLVKMPLKWVSATADMIIDLSIFMFGYFFYLVDAAVRLTVTPVGWILPIAKEVNRNKFIPMVAYKYTRSAAERLGRSFVATSTNFSDSDIPVFSILAHESLNNIQAHLLHGIRTIISAIHKTAEANSSKALAIQSVKDALGAILLRLQQLYSLIWAATSQWVLDLPSLIKSNPLQINLEIPRRTTPIDYNLAQWSIRDRIFAVLLGYIFFSVAGAAYLRIRSSIRDFQENERSDGVLVDALNQAGGVIKVILIITIEMTIFPLYCGMLLDIALLPLFGGSTVLSRLLFTANSPATSLFIHWFVGTCYMFHFALFVSMCRKIMRPGVLCKFSASSPFG